MHSSVSRCISSKRFPWTTATPWRGESTRALCAERGLLLDAEESRYPYFPTSVVNSVSINGIRVVGDCDRSYGPSKVGLT